VIGFSERDEIGL